jgi:PDZ domain
MTRRFVFRWLQSAALLAAVLLAPGPAQAHDPQIDQWIDQLDGDQYQVREQATRQLLDSGTKALDALTAAASGDRPEPADRAVWILHQLANTDDIEVRRQVYEHIIQIKNRPQDVVEAQDALAEIKHNLAVQAIVQLGGRVQEQQSDPRWPQDLGAEVVLDDHWTGGDEGLSYLLDLRDLKTVTLIRTNVTRHGLEQLKAIDTLRFLHLYGTQLDQTDADELQKLLPSVEFDFRRGALLGIRGSETAPARVLSVQPGTAAATVDIRVNDIIRKFNDKPVADFKELTGEIAKHRDGDEVSLEIERGSQTKVIQLKLGRWETM